MFKKYERTGRRSSLAYVNGFLRPFWNERSTNETAQSRRQIPRADDVDHFELVPTVKLN